MNTIHGQINKKKTIRQVETTKRRKIHERILRDCLEERDACKNCLSTAPPTKKGN